MTTLDIVIVNWNSGRHLWDCLSSVAATNQRGWALGRVVVVDNGSTDDSLLRVDSLRLPLVLRRNNTNRGFAAACNQGASGSSSDALLFLNPDARLYADTLDAMMQFLLEHSRAGICGVALEGADGHVHRSCTRLPTAHSIVIKALGLDRFGRCGLHSHAMTEWRHSETRRVVGVTGALYMVRRSLFEELNGFDERYFVYYEELDFSTRAHAAGWECWFLNPPRAYHLGGGTTDAVKPTRLFYSLRSRLQYSAKHFDFSGCLGVLLVTLFVEPVLRVLVAAARLAIGQIGDTVIAYARLWSWLAQVSIRGLTARG